MVRTVRTAVIAILLLLPVAALAAPTRYQLKVDGLACPFCAYGIEKKLGALDGVAALETSIKDGTVIVTMEEGATLDEATAKRAVEDAGFTLNGFERVSPGSSP